MTDTPTVTIVEERAELMSRWELLDKWWVDGEIHKTGDDFDYIDVHEQHTPRIAAYTMARGTADEHVEYIDTDDLMGITDTSRSAYPHLADWDAIATDTVYSATLVKLLEGDDDGFVRIGRIYS